MEEIEQLQRAKRYLSFFSGVFFLDLVAGITGDDNGTLLGVELAKIESISIVIVFVVVFYGIRIVNFRAAEGEKYRGSLQYRIDDYGHLFIGANVVIIGLADTFFHQFIECIGVWWSIAASVVLSGIIVSLVLVLFSNFNDASSGKQASLDQRIVSKVLSGTWYLIFANNVGQSLASGQNYKQLVFEQDGSFSAGSNKNESGWRVLAGFLEILNQRGEVYSRFSYREKDDLFRATGDSDVQALPNQRIVRDVEQWDHDGRP